MSPSRAHSSLEHSVAHPLIRAMPKLGPFAKIARRVGLAWLRAGWKAGHLELELPDGTLEHIGERRGAPARARVRDDRAFARVLTRGEMGAGEGYVAGDWDADDLVAVIRAFLQGTRARGAESLLTRAASLVTLWRHRRAANSRLGSARNISAHYDLGNDFYDLFLDAETMMYSCGIWPRDADRRACDSHDSLAQAQRNKLERLCELLALTSSDHLLEIGSGWGGMAIHAARTRGCRVTSITISREQFQRARERVQAAGLADRVDIRLCDYRDLRGTYDKLVSIEMIEAVGYEYLPTYFRTCAAALRPGGRMALQSITMPDDRFDNYRRNVDWTQAYIFPGALIPSLGALRDASSQAGLLWESECDIGQDYAPTLRAWSQRFAARAAEVRALGFDEPFLRMWRLYLAFSEASFAERTLTDHQIVLRRG